MAAPTVSIAITFSRTQVIVTDDTGAYNVTTNPGGYGTPNNAFSDYAHYCILRKKGVGDTADAVMTLDAYTPTSATEFTATRTLDGWYEATKLTITKWTAGTYPADTVRYNGGSVYIANTSTSGTPGVSSDWDAVTDLTEIEDNDTLIATIDGRVTVYNADTYWSKQIAANSKQGNCGICSDDRQKDRLDRIYFHIQAALVADQLGDNENGEWSVQALILLGAKL